MRPALVSLLLLAACAEPAPPAPPKKEPVAKPPRRVLVDRILLAFEGNAQGIESYRPKERARELAYSLLERIRGGADFNLLKAEYSDDPAKPLPYVLCDYGVALRRREDGLAEIPRGAMFGQLPFTLEPGGVAVLDYDPKVAPAGWDVVKRLR